MVKQDNLRNEIDYELRYVDASGQVGVKVLHIGFISQSIYKDYTEIINEAKEAIELSENIKKLTSDMGSTLTKRKTIKDASGRVIQEKLSPSALKEEMQSLKREYDRAIGRLADIANNTAEKKHNLIVKILTKNAISDSDLYSKEWWEECTSIHEVMSFIHAACSKDDAKIEGKRKKKVM